MDKKNSKQNIDTDAHLQQKPLSQEAQRALKEAAKRREHETNENHPSEKGGRGGKDPARYGDWEIKGRAIDF